jgi:putative alpha-1,2-mannosidase
MEARNLSEKNIYIKNVILNGKEWGKPYFMYDELVNGGSITFVMSDKPNKKWGQIVDFNEMSK